MKGFEKNLRHDEAGTAVENPVNKNIGLLTPFRNITYPVFGTFNFFGGT